MSFAFHLTETLLYAIFCAFSSFYSTVLNLKDENGSGQEENMKIIQGELTISLLVFFWFSFNGQCKIVFVYRRSRVEER